MLVAARPNKKHGKSSVWTTFDLKDANNNVIPAHEYLRINRDRIFITKGEPQSGKERCVCKLKKILIYRRRMCSWKSGATGENFLEECNKHEDIRLTEKKSDGIPYRWKKRINKSLKPHHKFTPPEACTHTQDEFNVMLTP